MPAYNPNSVWKSPQEDKDPAARERSEAAGDIATSGAKASSMDGQNAPAGPSFFKQHSLALFTVGIFIAIGIGASIYYLLQPAPAPNIVISYSNPGTIVVGEPFPLTITVANDSKSTLTNAQLQVVLPQGIVPAGSDPKNPSSTVLESLGTFSSGTVNPSTTLQLIALGTLSGTTQTPVASLIYQLPSTPNATYQSTAVNMPIAIGQQAALSLSYSGPSSVESGQAFPLTVNYANTSGQPLQDVELVMSYPPAYRFASVNNSAPADLADTIFPLGDLAPNATGTIVLNGSLTGPAQAQYQLNGAIATAFGGKHYPAASASANFVVIPSPLSFAIAVNDTSTYIAGLSDTLRYVLTYTNNSAVAFQAAKITATLTGRMFDLASLATDGSFDSRTNTITWYAATTPALASIAPGQTGSVSFTVATKGSFPIKLPSDVNYLLSVSSTIQSPTVPPNAAGSSTVSVASAANKIGGVMTLAATGYARETHVPSFKNAGPYPPAVDQATTYTVHWDIVNYATDMKNVTVSSYLQSGTTFTGLATSTAPSSTLTYDSGTGLVTWTIPDIPGTIGVTGAPDEAVFQVSNTPGVNEIGQQVTLVGPSTLTGTDAFTGEHVQGSADPVTTLLPNDPSAAGKLGDVTQ